MNFCCDKFEEEYLSLNTFSDVSIRIAKLGNVYEVANVVNQAGGSLVCRKVFLQRIWNDKLLRYINIKIEFCPYCGVSLQEFYTDGNLINTTIEDGKFVDSPDDVILPTRIEENNNNIFGKAIMHSLMKRKKRRESKGIYCCCGDLEFLYDSPKDYAPVNFTIAKFNLEKSMAECWYIERKGEKIEYKKPVPELSFWMCSRVKNQKNLPPEKLKRALWNFCPFCGKNLYQQYDNIQYANESEGADFALPEPERSLYLMQDDVILDKMSPWVIGAMLIAAAQKLSNKSWGDNLMEIMLFFLVIFALLLLVKYYIKYKRTKWLRCVWLPYWKNAVDNSFMVGWSFAMILSVVIETIKALIMLG